MPVDEGQGPWSVTQGELHPRRQRLATELRRLRDISGMSGRDLAQRTGTSQSKVSRIEAGSAIPSLPEVTAWADAVGASTEVRDRLVAMTEAVFNEVSTWRTALQTRTHLQDDIREQELAARSVRTFQPSLVPGLLQTAEYTRLVFSLLQKPYDQDGIPPALAGRLQRQLALYETDRQFDFLITEAALRWRPGPPQVLLPQLDRIASLSTLDNVSVGVIPTSQQAVTLASHGFVIYDGSDDDQDTIITFETIHANFTVHDPAEIELYKDRWSLLQQMAVVDDEARTLLAALGTEIRQTAR